MERFEIRQVESERDYRESFQVMRELRPHLTDVASFTEQVRRQAECSYQLLAVWEGDEIKALAGYRVQENLLYGRFLYVDDLVTLAVARRHGLGRVLIERLREEARSRGCRNFVLDTALSNPLGQRFYFRQGLLAVGMHFRQAL